MGRRGLLSDGLGRYRGNAKVAILPRFFLRLEACTLSTRGHVSWTAAKKGYRRSCGQGDRMIARWLTTDDDACYVYYYAYAMDETEAHIQTDGGEAEAPGVGCRSRPGQTENPTSSESWTRIVSTRSETVRE